MKVIVTIKTEKPESVKVYLKEILNRISKNKYFQVTDYGIKTAKDEV